MLTTLAPLHSNIDSTAGASLEARIDRAPLSRSDVALIREEVLSKSPAGKSDFAKIQTALNQWSEQSGLDLTSISRTRAMSVG